MNAYRGLNKAKCLWVYVFKLSVKQKTSICTCDCHHIIIRYFGKIIKEWKETLTHNIRAYILTHTNVNNIKNIKIIQSCLCRKTDSINNMKMK